MAQKQHYVNNKKLESVITTWINDFHVCMCLDRKRPKIPEYAGRAILAIIEGLSTRYNFSKYTYRDEMVGDALVHVCTYLSSFNAIKGTAFNFISFAAYNSFSARIKQEHRQTYYKNKNLQFMANAQGIKDENGKFIDPGLARMVNDGNSSDFAEKVANYEEKYRPQKKEKVFRQPTKNLFALALEMDKGEEE